MNSKAWNLLSFLIHRVKWVCCWSSGEQQEQLKAARVQYSRWLKKLLPGSSANRPCNAPFPELKCHKGEFRIYWKTSLSSITLRNPGMTPKVQYFQLLRDSVLDRADDVMNTQTVNPWNIWTAEHIFWCCDSVPLCWNTVYLEICGLANISQDKGNKGNITHHNAVICHIAVIGSAFTFSWIQAKVRSFVDHKATWNSVLSSGLW